MYKKFFMTKSKELCLKFCSDVTMFCLSKKSTIINLKINDYNYEKRK